MNTASDQCEIGGAELPDWVMDAANEVAEQLGCDANAGADSEVLLSLEVTVVHRLEVDEAEELFSAALKDYDQPGPVYQVEWVIWVCKTEFDLDAPWHVVRREGSVYLVEEELRNPDFENGGMGCWGRYLEWSQGSGESFDASSDRRVPDEVVDGLIDKVQDWGYEITEWFGRDDEKLTAKHPLLVGMLPKFRKTVMQTIRANR